MNNKKSDNDEQQAPFFGSWNRIYWIVALVLVSLIIIFYIFTVYFS